MLKTNVYKYLIRIPDTNKILIVPHRNGSSAIRSAAERHWINYNTLFLDATSLDDYWCDGYPFRDIFDFIMLLAYFNEQEFEQYEFLVPVRSPIAHLRSISELNRKRFMHDKEKFLDANTLKTITDDQLDKFSTVFALGIYFGIQQIQDGIISYFHKYDHACPSFIRASLLAAIGLKVTPLSMDSNEFTDFVNSNLMRRGKDIRNTDGYTLANRSPNHGEAFDKFYSECNNNTFVPNSVNAYLNHLDEIYNIFTEKTIDKNTGVRIIESVLDCYEAFKWHSELMPMISDLISLGMIPRNDILAIKFFDDGLNERFRKINIVKNYDLKWTQPYV